MTPKAARPCSRIGFFPLPAFRSLVPFTCCALPAFGAWAHAPPPFFKDRTITIVTSTGAGGSYDVTARAVARHMPRHIPGQPTMVVNNMPGGGNLLATNYMFNIAPKDGTAIASLHNAMPLHQALGGQGVRFDAMLFNWLGSMGPDNSAVLVWRKTGIATFGDLKTRETVLGGTGAGSGIVIYPLIMNKVLGTRFKIVTGYRSSEEINVAMERGEVEARTLGLTSIFSQSSDWLKDGKITILAQIGAKRDARLPDVPLLSELAATEEQRQVVRLVASPTALGRPYVAPPGVDAERLATLRHAFEAVMKDKAFLEEAEKRNIEVDPMSAEEVREIIRETINAPKAAVGIAAGAIDTAEGRK